jgi:hypothetical protein
VSDAYKVPAIVLDELRRLERENAELKTALARSRDWATAAERRALQAEERERAVWRLVSWPRRAPRAEGQA